MSAGWPEPTHPGHTADGGPVRPARAHARTCDPDCEKCKESTRPLRPEFVHMGPYTYRVTSDPVEWAGLLQEEGHDLWGFTHNTRGIIYLQPDVNPSLERTTMLHELMHMAAFCGGTLHDGPREEEAWVLVAAPPLLDALRRTPGLLEWLAWTDG